MKVLYLEFATPANRAASLYELTALLEAINNVLTDLVFIAFEEGEIVVTGDIDVVSLELESPLKIVLGIARLPKSAVRAFIGLGERILFLKEERDRRAAMAASAWEDAPWIPSVQP